MWTFELAPSFLFRALTLSLSSGVVSNLIKISVFSSASSSSPQRNPRRPTALEVQIHRRLRAMDLAVSEEEPPTKRARQAEDEEDDGPPRTSSLKAPIMLLTGHEAPIYTTKFSPGGRYLASGSHDKRICKFFAARRTTWLLIMIFVCDSCRAAESCFR